MYKDSDVLIVMVSNMPNQEQQQLRLDKWLWFARFYKTRKLATEAVTGGHIHLNGERVKPSRLVGTGDCLRIRRGLQTMTVDVRAIAKRRGPASEAQKMYIEHEQSIVDRNKVSQQFKLTAAATLRPHKRPDKRARRQLLAAKNKLREQ